MPGPALCQATWLAGAMFARTGVHVEWRSGRPSRFSSERPIVIELAANAPDHVSPGALAFAQPYEGIHITILYHRIEYIAVHHQFMDRLLAHVLVHEITHIVEGVDRHSDAGVMKAHWTQVDYGEIESSLLPFTPEDVRLIYEGLAGRSSRAAAKTDTNGSRSSG